MVFLWKFSDTYVVPYVTTYVIPSQSWLYSVYVVTHATTYVETDVALFDRKNYGKHIASYVITYAATYVAVLKMTKFQHRLYHL